MSDIEPIEEAGILSAREILEKMPNIRESDSPMLRRYLTMLNEWEKLQAIREAEGVFTTNDKGGVVAHPVVKMIMDLESKLLSLEDRLGMNPAARIKLGAEDADRQKKEASLASMLDNIED